MDAKDKKPFGILMCIMVGIIILFASLYYSKVDQPQMKGEELVDFGEGWQVDVTNQVYSHINLPAHIEHAVLGDTLILKKLLPMNIESNTYILFRASHQNVKVYIGEEQVYTFGWDEKRLFGKSPACTWVVIPLTEEQRGASMRIELTGVYKRYANMINGVYIGEKSAIIQSIVSNRIGSIFICLGLVIIGVGMIVLTIALRNGRTTTSLQRLGILALLIGIWSSCVTNILQVFYGDVFFLLNLEFLVFNLLLPVFLWFLLSFPYYRERKWINRLFWASILQFMLIEVLQLTGIADYMESIKITHAMIIVATGYLIITGVRDLFQKKATREAKLLILSVSLVLVFAGIDLIRFYQVNVVDEGFYTRIGTMIFVVLWAIEVIRNMSKLFVNMAKTEALEILAYVDLMTGLKNRTAFEEWMNAYPNDVDNGEVSIIVFDMNGLKGINDNFGHMKGDQAIIAIADIIKEACEPHGVCYRIGGDEICVILTKTDSDENNMVTKILYEIEAAIASKSNEIKLEFSVAAGYSATSRLEDRDVFQAYREADNRMYERKQEMKRENPVSKLQAEDYNEKDPLKR